MMIKYNDTRNRETFFAYFKFLHHKKVKEIKKKAEKFSARGLFFDFFL